MNIFKKSLTEYSNWNKNYTKSSNRQVSSSFGMVGTPCLEAKYRLYEVVGQSLVTYLSCIGMRPTMSI
jgi:hypothetical protein